MITIIYILYIMGFIGLFIPDEQLSSVGNYNTIYSYIVNELLVDTSYNSTDTSYSIMNSDESFDSGSRTKIINYMKENKILFNNAYYRIDNILLLEEECLDNNSITSDISYVNNYNVDHTNYTNYGIKYLTEITVNVYDKYYNFLHYKTIKLETDEIYVTHFYKNLDKSSVNNLWEECYNYIKPLISSKIDNILTNQELFRRLDLSSTLLDY